MKLGDLLSVFLTSKGDVYTMGENFSGQLGIGEHKQQYSNPVRVNLELPVSGISCGTNHVFAYSKDCRAIYAWGSNMQHQILTSPNSANHYSSPTKLNHLLSSATTKIICKSRGTITISKLPVDSGKDEKSGISMISANSDNVKKLEMLMFAEKNEKENFKKTNMILGTENNQLKQELIQLKSALANAERSQKKILSLSVSTQTLGDVEESDPTFDGRLELISHAAF